MNEEDTQGLKNVITGAVIFMIGWGLLGLFNGDGFWGGIGIQFDAIGDIFVSLLEGLVFIGVCWLIIQKLKDRDSKKGQ